MTPIDKGQLLPRGTVSRTPFCVLQVLFWDMCSFSPCAHPLFPSKFLKFSKQSSETMLRNERLYNRKPLRSRGKGQGAKEKTSRAFQYWKNPLRNKRTLHKGKSRERLCPAVRVVLKAPSLILIPAFSRFYNTEILGCFIGWPYQQHQGPPSEFMERG